MKKISHGKRRRILDRDGWECQMPRCFAPAGRAIDPDLYGTHEKWSPSVDHVIPLAAGGTSQDSNLRAAHQWCNVRQGTLISNGRQSRPRQPWNGQVPDPEEIGGTDIASRLGPAAAALAALAEESEERS